MALPLPELIAAYAERMHRAASGHHVLSPLGAWLLLALVGPASQGARRDELGAVLGVDVGTRPDLDDVVPREAAAAADLAGRPAPTGTCRIDHDRFGDGYGVPTRSGRESLDLAARLEGLLLDPVYSGKAMAGLIAAIREDRAPDRGAIVFLATGGLPALLTPRYTDWVLDWPA